MTALSEGRHAAEFIISESNGQRSRENGTVKSGENLAAGEVVMLDGTKLVAYDGATGSTAIGVMIAAVDATGGDAKGAYIARDAEVNGDILTVAGNAGDATVYSADLAAVGIIVR